MSIHHLGVAEGTQETANPNWLAERLDAEIIPRLERPGRHLGPFHRELAGNRAPRAGDVALLWPSLVEGHRRPPSLKALETALDDAGQGPVELACTPPADLRAALAECRLPLFARPSWRALSACTRWIAWVDSPLQLPGLLVLLDAAGVARAAKDRPATAPRLLLAGPAIQMAPDCFAPLGELIPSTDPAVIVARLVARLVAKHVAKHVSPRATIDLSLPVGPSLEAVDLPVGLRQEFRCAGPAPRPIRLVIPSSGMARLELDMASAELRTQWDLPPVDSELADSIRQLLRQGRKLEIEAAIGWTGEDASHRQALVALLTDLAQAAPRGGQQIDLRLCGVWSKSTLEEAELAALFEEIGAKAAKLHMRFYAAHPAAAPRAAFLASLGTEAPAFASCLIDLGLDHADSPLAAAEELWQVAGEHLLEAAPGEPHVGQAEGNVPPGQEPHTSVQQQVIPTTGQAHGLGSFGVAEVEAPRKSSRRRGQARPPRLSRWLRWKSLVPQEYWTRISFARPGRLRWMAQGDLSGLIEAAAIAAGLPLATTGVAQPKPKLVFGPSIPHGIEGHREFVDLALSHPAEQLLESLAAHLPSGLELHAQCSMPGSLRGKFPLSSAAYADYEADLGQLDEEALRRATHVTCAWDPAAEEGLYHQVMDLHLDLAEGQVPTLRFRLDLGPKGSKLKPHQLLARVLGIDLADARDISLIRTRLWMRAPDGRGLLEPIEQAMAARAQLRAVAKLRA